MPLDWSACPAVESVLGKVSGAWVFRGTRIPVSAVFENLEDGLTIDQIVEMFDGLKREQVVTALDFAARWQCQRPRSPEAVGGCLNERSAKVSPLLSPNHAATQVIFGRN